MSVVDDVGFDVEAEAEAEIASVEETNPALFWAEGDKEEDDNTN